MGNVVGEPLEGYVIDQIIARQKLHGSGVFSGTGEGALRTENQLNMLNSNTAWIKLASGVSVNQTRLNQAEIKNVAEGEALAREYVLFGGTSLFNGNNLENRKGFLTKSDYPDNGDQSFRDSAYFQGEFGYSPMPGIVSADIKTLNRGSIKKASVKLKAHNKTQFAIIDLLYLRLGYTVLLEWGNTMYTTDGINRGLVKNTLLEDKFFSVGNKSSYLEFIGGTNSNTIATYRNIYDGNYDGFLGKISNFNWSFQPDGSYDIDLTIISLGDVIESLKTNIPLDKKFTSYLGTPSSSPTTSTDPIEANKNNNSLTAMLWLFKYFDDNPLYRGGSGTPVNIVDGSGNIKKIGNLLNVNSSGVLTTGYDYEYTYSIIGNGKNFTQKFQFSSPKVEEQADKKLIEIWNNQFASVTGKTVDFSRTIGTSIGKFITEIVNKQSYVVNYNRTLLSTSTATNPIFDAQSTDAFRLDVKNGDIPNQHYLRFGYLLNFIRNKVISKIDNGSASHDQKPPIVNLDTEGGIMYFIDNQISLDPTICVVRNDSFEKEFGVASVFPELEPFSDIDKGGNNPNAAYPSNIYLHFNFIIDSLTSSTDERGEINLYSFISSLCTGINRALGSVNNLEPIIEEDTNTIKILDTTPIPSAARNATKSYSIQLYGYDKTNSSYESTFVRKVDLKTAITPEYATMITVGATADGYVKGTEATAFSKWNKGLTDRFNNKLLPGNEASLEASGVDEAETNYIDKFQGKVIECYGFTSDWKNISSDIIANNVSVVTEYYKYIMAKDKVSSGGAVGFIPFKLGLTVDGISGIKIYNKISVDTSFLPSNYSDTLDFIVTGVSHTLQNNDWETTLETTVIPKTKMGIKSPTAKRTSVSSPPTPGIVVTGDNADFWALLAICVVEDGDRQGRADVAQSIYNRKGSKAYGNKSIKELITSPKQYQPTFDKKSPKGIIIAQVWKNINSLETAIKAIQYSKGYTTVQAETALKNTYDTLRNPLYREKAMDFVQGRTDFLGVGQPAISMTNNGSKRQRTSRDNQFGFSNNYRKNIVYNPPPIAWFINFNKDF